MHAPSLVTQIAQEKAELEEENAQVWRDLREHEALEKQQKEGKWKVIFVIMITTF